MWFLVKTSSPTIGGDHQDQECQVQRFLHSWERKDKWEDVGEQGNIESEVGELLAKLLDHWWWGVTS